MFNPSSVNRYRSIYDLLTSQTERIPDAIAIAAPGRAPLTYRALLNQVENVLRALSATGVGRNDRVAMVLPNGPEMAVAFLSVAARASAAPLNPAFREKEFAYYLSDLGARAVIVHSGIDSPARSAAKVLGIPVLELSSVQGAAAGIFTLRGAERSVPVCEDWSGPEDVALVLHTSGTTSRPKMAPLTLRNLSWSAYHIRKTLELTEKDRCLNVMPLFHIHGLVGSVLASLMAGGSVVCTSGFDAEKFFEWLAEFRPTWYTAVPTVHQAILACAQTNGKMLERSPLRFIRSSSAALPPRVMQELEEVFHVPVIEAYGMTEASHQIASNPLPPGERKSGSVGVAAGSEIAIIDESRNFLSPGESGEIVIRGANITQGYENNPEVNEEAFTGEWFRTGDQGFLDTDGYLFITGRLKEIINRAGEKISPYEIDETLMDHPDICQAAAFAAPHPSLGEDVAAAVVLRQDKRLTESMIREYLLGRLAAFKVPAKIWIVDDIPKGPSGKIQRTALAEKFAEQLKRDFIPPRTKLEAMVAAIYAEVLDLERVGADGNFFALGGDSLRAMQIISRIRAAFQINFSIATLFRKVTVAELAEEITGSAESVDPSVMAEILTEVTSLSDEATEKLLADELDQDPSVK